jgi:hypothetical protein
VTDTWLEECLGGRLIPLPGGAYVQHLATDSAVDPMGLAIAGATSAVPGLTWMHIPAGGEGTATDYFDRFTGIAREGIVAVPLAESADPEVFEGLAEWAVLPVRLPAGMVSGRSVSIDELGSVVDEDSGVVRLALPSGMLAARSAVGLLDGGGTGSWERLRDWLGEVGAARDAAGVGWSGDGDARRLWSASVVYAAGAFEARYGGAKVRALLSSAVTPTFSALTALVGGSAGQVAADDVGRALRDSAGSGALVRTAEEVFWLFSENQGAWPSVRLVRPGFDGDAADQLVGEAQWAIVRGRLSRTGVSVLLVDEAGRPAPVEALMSQPPPPPIETQPLPVPDRASESQPEPESESDVRWIRPVPPDWAATLSGAAARLGRHVVLFAPMRADGRELAAELPDEYPYHLTMPAQRELAHTALFILPGGWPGLTAVRRQHHLSTIEPVPGTALSVRPAADGQVLVSSRGWLLQAGAGATFLLDDGDIWRTQATSRGTALSANAVRNAVRVLDAYTADVVARVVPVTDDEARVAAGDWRDGTVTDPSARVVQRWIDPTVAEAAPPWARELGAGAGADHDLALLAPVAGFRPSLTDEQVLAVERELRPAPPRLWVLPGDHERIDELRRLHGLHAIQPHSAASAPRLDQNVLASSSGWRLGAGFTMYALGVDGQWRPAGREPRQPLAHHLTAVSVEHALSLVASVRPEERLLVSIERFLAERDLEVAWGDDPPSAPPFALRSLHPAALDDLDELWLDLAEDIARATGQTEPAQRYVDRIALWEAFPGLAAPEVRLLPEERPGPGTMNPVTWQLEIHPDAVLSRSAYHHLFVRAWAVCAAARLVVEATGRREAVVGLLGPLPDRILDLVMAAPPADERPMYRAAAAALGDLRHAGSVIEDRGREVGRIVAQRTCGRRWSDAMKPVVDAFREVGRPPNVATTDAGAVLWAGSTPPRPPLPLAVPVLTVGLDRAGEVDGAVEHINRVLSGLRRSELPGGIRISLDLPAGVRLDPADLRGLAQRLDPPVSGVAVDRRHLRPLPAPSPGVVGVQPNGRFDLPLSSAQVLFTPSSVTSGNGSREPSAPELVRVTAELEPPAAPVSRVPRIVPPAGTEYLGDVLIAGPPQQTVLASVQAAADRIDRPLVLLTEEEPDLLGPVVERFGWVAGIRPIVVVAAVGTPPGEPFDELVSIRYGDGTWTVYGPGGAVRQPARSLDDEAFRVAAGLADELVEPYDRRLPAALADWAQTGTWAEAAATFDRLRSDLLRPEVVAGLGRIIAADPGEPRWVVLHTIVRLEIEASARPARSRLPIRPTATDPWEAVPVPAGALDAGFVFGYVEPKPREAQLRWDGLLVSVLLGGLITAPQVIALTSVLGDRANALVFRAFTAIVTDGESATAAAQHLVTQAGRELEPDRKGNWFAQIDQAREWLAEHGRPELDPLLDRFTSLLANHLT